VQVAAALHDFCLLQRYRNLSLVLAIAYAHSLTPLHPFLAHSHLTTLHCLQLLVPKVVVQLERARTELADVGVDLADHIPSIVVVGDQSTGKSSLLSALTDLKLPDGNATITRAPLKILIRPGEEKCAKLRYKLRTLSGGVEYK
jgi:hypothetical protein